ncbi:exotoxin [Serratia marcescens]|uniref:MrpH family fimbial adhesin n=1 Tax=Serratia marcescens TaxID=615 RepID=UPI00320473B2
MCYLRTLIFLIITILPLGAYGSAWVSVGSRTATGYTGEFSWPSEEADGVLCYTSSCSVAVCHYSSVDSEMCTRPKYAFSSVTVTYGTTFKEAREVFIKKNGVSGYWATKTPLLYAQDTCFGVLYWQGTDDPNRTGAKIPGSYCGRVPPVTTVCDMTSDIYFDYGVLQSNLVNGASSTKTFRVWCNQPANVLLTLVGNARIQLGNEVDAALFIDNTDLSRGFLSSIQSGERFFNITSVLRAKNSNISGGEFSGGGIIVIGFP